MTPEILSRTPLHEGHLKLERLRLRLPDGAEAEREVESHGEAVVVLPYDPQRRVALTARLFRAPVLLAGGGDTLEEACAGMIDPGESADAAVRREADEELGLQLGELERVARVFSTPGVSTERQTLYLAPYAPGDRTGQGGGAQGEHEGIAVLERPLAELAADADAGRIADGKLLTLVLALRLRRPDLFG